MTDFEESLLKKLSRILDVLGWIALWLFLIFIGGCNGCFHLSKY